MSAEPREEFSSGWRPASNAHRKPGAVQKFIFGDGVIHGSATRYNSASLLPSIHTASFPMLTIGIALKCLMYAPLWKPS